MEKTFTKKTQYTSRANPMRGYHDSVTVLTFTDGTDDEQERTAETERKRLALENMWTGPAVKTGVNEWTINHGYDSGD